MSKEKKKKPLTEKQLQDMPGDKKPYYIWDTEGARLFYEQTEEVQKAWNDYARREADKVTDPGIVDWSPALAHNWTPPLSIKQWLSDQTQTTDIAELIARLETPIYNEKLMRQWDYWRKMHKGGFSGSQTRDEFESIIDAIDEERKEAAKALKRLRAP